MNLATIIVLPKTLQEKLGEDASNDLVGLLDKLTERQKETFLEAAADRIEQKVSAEINRLDSKIAEEIAKLRVDIEKLKADLVKWMFVFWASQFAAVVGIIAMLLKR